MKRYFRVLIVSFILGCLFCDSVFAETEDNITDVLLPDSLLENFEEKEAIEALAPEILDMANAFVGDGFYGELSDIDFSKAYCVYVEAGILEKDPKNLKDLREALESGKLVWCIPVVSGENTVLVQVSKAPELSEIEQGELTEEEWEEAKARAGKWRAVSSSLYEQGDGLPEEKLCKLISEDKETEEKFVLIGGEPEFHYLMAVRVEGETVTEVVPLDGELPEAENKSLSRAFYIVCAAAVGIVIVLIVEEKFAGRGKS